MTAYQDIVIEQGSTFVWTHQATGDRTTETATLKARAQHASASTILSLSTGSGITAAFASGKTTWTATVTAAATALLAAPQQGVFDFKTTTAGGVVERHVEGAFYVTPESSR